MRMEKKDVKSKTQVVGVAEYEIYDSLKEACDAMGEEVVLDLVNAQHRTNKLNAIRAAATGKPPKAQIKAEAYSRLTNEELVAARGDFAKLEQTLAIKMKEVEAEWAARATTAGETTEEDED